MKLRTIKLTYKQVCITLAALAMYLEEATRSNRGHSARHNGTATDGGKHTAPTVRDIKRVMARFNQEVQQ